MLPDLAISFSESQNASARLMLVLRLGIATLILRYFLRYFSSLFFFDFHRTNFSRFRRTFHSFDPVGFAIFAIFLALSRRGSRCFYDSTSHRDSTANGKRPVSSSSPRPYPASFLTMRPRYQS